MAASRPVFANEATRLTPPPPPPRTAGPRRRRISPEIFPRSYWKPRGPPAWPWCIPELTKAGPVHQFAVSFRQGGQKLPRRRVNGRAGVSCRFRGKGSWGFQRRRRKQADLVLPRDERLRGGRSCCRKQVPSGADASVAAGRSRTPVAAPGEHDAVADADPLVFAVKKDCFCRPSIRQAGPSGPERGQPI